jgi:hypothetical protein
VTVIDECQTYLMGMWQGTTATSLGAELCA